MHKLNLPIEPSEWSSAVVAHCQAYPPASGKTEGTRWKAFCNTKSAAFKAAQIVLQKNQHEICAYCEMSTKYQNHQIEHFIPKCRSSQQCDHTFDFSNFLLCCKGGTYPFFTKLPGSYSTDPSAIKNHTCGDSKKDIDPSGVCLNPYEIPNYCLFTHKGTIDDGLQFIQNKEACARAGIPVGLVESTIKTLNLNCLRLSKSRENAWDEISQQIHNIKNEHLKKTTRKSRISARQRIPQRLKELVKKHLKKNNPLYTTAFLCIKRLLPEMLPVKLR